MWEGSNREWVGDKIKIKIKAMGEERRGKAACNGESCTGAARGEAHQGERNIACRSKGVWWGRSTQGNEQNTRERDTNQVHDGEGWTMHVLSWSA